MKTYYFIRKEENINTIFRDDELVEAQLRVSFLDITLKKGPWIEMTFKDFRDLCKKERTSKFLLNDDYLYYDELKKYTENLKKRVKEYNEWISINEKRLKDYEDRNQE